MVARQLRTVELKYPKYDFVSNWWEYYMLWLGPEMFIADIPWQNPNITQLAIN
jgi:hypothetical protein